MRYLNSVSKRSNSAKTSDPCVSATPILCKASRTSRQFFPFLAEVCLAFLQRRHRDVVRVHFTAQRKIFSHFLESLLKGGADIDYGIVAFTKAFG